MRIAFFGDIVGRAGRDGLGEHLLYFYAAVFSIPRTVVVNAENAAAGLGITEANTARCSRPPAALIISDARQLPWDQKEALIYIVREAAYDPAAEPSCPAGRAGRGLGFSRTIAAKVARINLLGFDFEHGFLDDPFAADRGTERLPLGPGPPTPSLSTCTPRATLEKMAMGHFRSKLRQPGGRHEHHVLTADCQIRNGGTGRQTLTRARCCD